MRKKFTLIFAAVAGIILGLVALAKDVDAEVGTTTIADNPSSPQVLTVTRQINNQLFPVRNTFRYILLEDEGNPAAVTIPNSVQELKFEDVYPVDDIATQAFDYDFSGLTFSRVGEYHFTLREDYSTYANRYTVDGKQYDITVIVENKLDEDGFPTGELTATLVDKAKIGGGKADIEFDSSVKNTVFELSKTVKGSAADTEEYFKFDLLLGNSFEETYTISGLDETVTYKGETIENPTSVVSNTGTYVYLKHGQTAVIGLREDGKFELPVGSRIGVDEVIDAAEGWTTTIDGEEQASVIKHAAESPATGGSVRDFELNNKINIVNKKDGAGVDTGVTLNMILPLALLAVGAVGLLIAKRLTAIKK